MPEYTHEDLRQVVEEAGFDMLHDGPRFGPCPLCGGYGLTIREAEPGDPFLYCGRTYEKFGDGIHECCFGAGVSALRSWMRKGWRVGRPLPRGRRGY